MRIAIISDTHLPKGSRRLPETCLERLRRADLILHAGDWSAAPVRAEIEALGPPVKGVHGNVDDAVLRRSLPAELELELEGHPLAVVHDAGPSKGRLARLRRRFPEAEAAIFGHSHMPLLEDAGDGAFQIFNPGSPTERRRAPAHTMGICELADSEPPRFELIEL